MAWWLKEALGFGPGLDPEAKEHQPIDINGPEYRIVRGSGWSVGPRGESFRQRRARLAKTYGEEAAETFTGSRRTF